MSKMTDDRNTITRLRRGDREAFACLYRRYWRKVYHFTSLYITSGADVEEVVQDVFVKLWENRARIDESQSIEGYLFIITRNHVFNYLSFASDFSLSGSNRELVKGQFHCSDLFVV